LAISSGTTTSNPDNQNYLFRNDCNGSFTRITDTITNTNFTTGGYAPGVWMDYDNDGDLDMVLYKGRGSNPVPKSAELYINNGSGSFTRSSDGVLINDTLRPRSASVVDYDNDGWLDIYVANRSVPSNLYRNNQSGDFIKITTGDIVSDIGTGASNSSAWGDFDNDGDMDCYVGASSYGFFYTNNGNGTFTKITGSPITNVAGSNYGPCWVDYDNDGDLDLFLQDAFSPNLLFMNNDSGTFTQVTAAPFVQGNGQGQGGATWGDYDNDGDLDLFLANDNFIASRFFVNNGNGTFTEDTTEIITNDVLVEAAAATFADIDNDGDLDLYVCNAFASNGPSNYLYTNKGNCNNWVKIKCIGTQTNKQAIGARVYVKATINGVQTNQMREINGNCNLSGGANGVTAAEEHFGIGNAVTIDELKIVWPKSGITEVFTNVSPNEFYDETEGTYQLVSHTACGSSSTMKERQLDNTSNENSQTAPIAIENVSNFSVQARVYPNPNNGNISVEVNDELKAQNAEFVLYDLLGHKLFASRLFDNKSSFALNGNGVDQGIYYYNIVAANGQIIKHEKLVIIK